jgi:hypothetical protein
MEARKNGVHQTGEYHGGTTYGANFLWRKLGSFTLIPPTHTAIYSVPKRVQVFIREEDVKLFVSLLLN